MQISADATKEQFYRLGLHTFRKAQKHGYPPQPPRGATGSKNALYLLARGWIKGRKAAFGFIRAQFWLHPSVGYFCDTTGALHETRSAKKSGKWENGDPYPY